MLPSQTPTENDLAILKRCAPVADLDASAHQRVLDAVVVSMVPAGQDIITQGAAGDAFFILLVGTAEVLKEENGKVLTLNELQAGSYFGEQALLGNKSGRRAATVRAKTACRVGSVGADVFSSLIAASGQNRDRFESDASAYVYQGMTKSLNAFIATELDDTAEGVQRLHFKPGEILVHEGDASDSAYLMLSGVAWVYKTLNGVRRELARMGGGQIFGELGVLTGEPRSATVVAESEMEVLKISAPAFVRWQKANPDSAGFFTTLSNVYRLSQGRQMSVFLGEVGGAKAVTSVVGRPTDGVVSVRMLDKGVVVFTNAGAGTLPGERAVMTYADDKIKRELRVIVQERKAGKIERCIVYAVSAEGIENDLGTLYQNVLNLDEVHAVELRRFERTGFLGGAAAKSDRLCPCLGIGPKELTAAMQELGSDYAALHDNLGVGGICGGCERTVRTFLAQGPAPLRSDDEPAAYGGPEAPAETPAAAGPVADVPPDLLTKDERQLAALFARGMGPAQSVTREQLAVRLRATGVRDMNYFIDLLFPGVFTKYARATYATLAVAVSRGVGFGTWREDALKPRSFAAEWAHKAVLGIYALGRKGIVAVLLLAAALSFAVAPERSGVAWGAFAAVVALAFAVLSLTPSGRFVRTLITAGPARYYRALWAAFGKEQTAGVLRMPGGPPTYIVRDERLVDQILQNPHIYARLPVTGYPPFAEHSVLGGGSSGVWLGYRVLFEEYFAEGYQEDLAELRAIVRERMGMWEGRESLDLLKEIYRIMVEIRARIFFQTTFDCFDDGAKLDFAGIVDRVLSPQVLALNGDSDGEVDILRARVLEAVNGSTRKNSIGGIILEAWRAGDLNEREARENGVLYVLAQAPTMAVFWTLYRAAHTQRQDALRGSHREIVKSIKEELRLHAPVTSMFRRQVLRDDRLGDMAVKRGDLIILCPMYIHTNDKHWTAPFQFDPNRWTAATGDGKEIVEPKTDAADAHSRPHPLAEGAAPARYLPFGGGGQACQGRWFAADEMLIVVEEILTHYDLQILDDQGLLEKPLHEQVSLHVYNRPSNDVRVRPIRRA